MKFPNTLIAAALATAFAGQAMAAVSADEAKQLGTTLTLTGAEKGANKDGTIPAFTGTPVAAPAAFKAGSGIRPDPFASEKPRAVITGKNVGEYADKLTEGTKELLKRHAGYRVDVYPTHRTAVLPKQVLDNAQKNATGAKTAEGGLVLENAYPGVPFPIPKTGNEAMWNHLVRYQSVGFTAKYDTWNVDSAGVPTLATTGEASYEWPIYSPGKIATVMKADDPYWRLKLEYKAPARRAGEALMLVDSVNPLEHGRRAWQYLPGQRRVKLAPDIAYDTPNPGLAGAATYDDAQIFNGAMDRFDFKLVGKKEMILPYNAYRLSYHPTMEEITKPNFVNPDLLRWELHRAWVVEATLKPGKRHAYSKRIFYIDEDSWTVLASDQYDARGQLYRSGFAAQTFSYDAGAISNDTQLFYDFISGSYSIAGLFGKYYLKYRTDALPANQWSQESLAGAGVR
jgi:hypothetical protein